MLKIAKANFFIFLITQNTFLITPNTEVFQFMCMATADTVLLENIIEQLF